MSGAIPSLPQYAFMAWCSVKEKSTVTTLQCYSHSQWVGAFENIDIDSNILRPLGLQCIACF